MIPRPMPRLTKDQIHFLGVALGTFAVCALANYPALAQTTVSAIMCSVVNELTGPLGKVIGSIGVIIIGINAMIGRTSWSAAIIVATGVGIIFSAKGLVAWMMLGTTSAGAAGYCP